MKKELPIDKFNCVHDNPYKTHCTLIPEVWSNPTGRQFSMLPFGINLEETLNRYTDNIFPTQQSINKHHMFPNKDGNYMVPQTLDPRPAIRIGYEYRNS